MAGADGAADQGGTTGTTAIGGLMLVQGPDVPIPPREEDGGATGEDISEEAMAQAPLMEAARKLDEASVASGVDGLATINPDFDADRIDLYWKGELPATLLAAIAEVRDEFEVVVHASPYTWTELDRKVRKVLELLETDETLGFITAIAMTDDVSGIRALVSDPSIDTQHAESAIRSAIGHSVPLTFGFEEWATHIKPTRSRWDDRPPFNGGAVIQRYWLGLIVAARCSTAFTVRNSADTVRGVLTAKHCGENDSWYTPESDLFVGNSNLVLGDRDMAGLMWGRTTPGYPGFRGRMYVGGPNSTTDVPINGSSRSYLDSLYCLSGGYSGLVCANRVLSRNLYPSGLGGPMFLTRHNTGRAAAGNGDSGGPTYYSSSTGRFAKGIISAIDANRIRPCEGIPSGGGRECSDTVLHVELGCW
ncbi:MAG: hypothetical protein ACRDQ7_14045 [Haloechinothrix sp.]